MTNTVEQALRLAMWMTMKDLAKLFDSISGGGNNGEKAYWERKSALASRLANQLEVELEVAEAKGDDA